MLSREIFREYDIRGVTGKDLTPDVARLVARGYAAFLAEKGGQRRDCRRTRQQTQWHRRCTASSLPVCWRAGSTSSTSESSRPPLAYWAQHNLEVAGGIQITGSHNPPEFNGFKLGLGTRSIYGADIQHIYELAVAGKFPSGKGN